MNNAKKRNHGIYGILIGVGAATLICLCMTGGLSLMLLSQRIGEGSVEICISMIMLVSSLFGCTIASILQSNKPLAASGVTAGLIILLVFLGSSIIDRPYHNAIMRMGAVVCGSMISYVICLKRSTKSVSKKVRHR